MPVFNQTEYQKNVDREVAALGSVGTPGPTNKFVTQADPGIGGSDPWTYRKLTSDFVTSSATAVDITSLGFTPAANTTYEFEAFLLTRTATTTVGPRPGLAWATGMSDGAAEIRQASAATTDLITNGNTSAAILCAVGGVPTTTGSWKATIKGVGVVGSNTTGTIRIQLASETAGTNVTAKTGSYLKYRTI